MSMQPLVIRQPRVHERGSGKDVFFGDQIHERYTAPSCAIGDTQISCTDVTSRVCSSYTRIFGCCDPADGGACGISVGCQHCEDKPTGVKTCECDRTIQQEKLDIEKLAGLLGGGKQVPETFPIGTAGTAVAATGTNNVLKGVLIVGVVGVVGYFLYKRSKGGGQGG